MNDDPSSPETKAHDERGRWLTRPKRLDSAGASDRMKALQRGFRKTGVGKSENKVSFGGLGKVVGPIGLAGVVLVSLWIIVRDDGAEQSVYSRSVYYQRCDDARADGAAPMRFDEPGYRPGLDADSDGIACEPLRVFY